MTDIQTDLFGFPDEYLQLSPLITQDPESNLLTYHKPEKQIQFLNEYFSQADSNIHSISSKPASQSSNILLNQIDPLLHVITICGQKNSGKKLLCHLLMLNSMQQRQQSNLFPTSSENLLRNSQSQYMKIEKNSSSKTLQSRRGIFLNIILDPTKEFHSLIQDKSYFLLDEELELQIMQSLPTEVSPSHNNFNNRVEDRVDGGVNLSLTKQPTITVLLLIQGMTSFTSSQISPFQQQSNKVLKYDPSLPDAVDAIFLQFCHFFSSTLVLNAPIYPHLPERDLVSLSQLLGLWIKKESTLSWSNLVNDTIENVHSIQNLNSKKTKGIRIEYTKQKLSPLTHQKRVNHNNKNAKRKLMRVEWSNSELEYHSNYFLNSTSNQSEFVYALRDVSQLSPVEGQSYLLQTFFTQPPTKTRQSRVEAMRKTFQHLFPYSRNIGKLATKAENENYKIGGPNIEPNPFKGMHIFSPMHSNPNIFNFDTHCMAYRNSLGRLKFYLLKNQSIKHIMEWPLSFYGLLDAADKFVTYVNTNTSIPSILKMVDDYQNFLIGQIVTKSIEKYREEKEKLLLPVSQEALIQHHQSIIPNIQAYIQDSTSNLPNQYTIPITSSILEKIGSIEEMDFHSIMRLIKDTRIEVEENDCKDRKRLISPNYSLSPKLKESKIHRNNSSRKIAEAWLQTHNNNLEIPTEFPPKDMTSTSTNQFLINRNNTSQLSEFKIFQLENAIESLKKCQSVLYRIYSKYVRPLREYESIDVYKSDFNSFLTEYKQYNTLGPAKDFVADEILVKEYRKLQLLAAILKQKSKVQNEDFTRDRQLTSLSQKINEMELYLDVAIKFKSQESRMDTILKKLDTQHIKLVLITEYADCDNQLSKTFSHRKHMIEFISKNYDLGYQVQSLYFFKGEYGIIMRKYSSNFIREKVIICQTHEIRSAVAGVWHEGFKYLQTLCFDERKKTWILVFRNHESYKHQYCKLIIEQHPNDLKSRLSRLCQKGYTILACAHGDSFFVFYLIQEESTPEAILLTGPFNYIQHKVQRLMKQKYLVKAICGDQKGNWIVFVQRSQIMGSILPPLNNYTSLTSSYNLNSIQNNTQNMIQNNPLIRETKIHQATISIGISNNRENIHQNSKDTLPQLQWIKTITQMNEAQEFISDIWKNLNQQIVTIVQASMESI